MSFDSMKVAELKEVAQSFGVDLEDAKTKNEILAILVEEGVTYNMYKGFTEAEKDEVEDFEEEEVKPAPKPTKQSKNTVLVKMERHNPSYQTYGFTFTTEHPFVAVPENVAQEIFDNESGFRMATPREIQEYYS